MAEVFSVRSLIYWWGFLSATVFLRGYLKDLANFLKTNDMFSQAQVPFNSVPGVNAAIDGASEYLTAQIKFNPTSVIVSAGPISLQNWMIAAVFGLLIAGAAVALYVRAIKTPHILDDFIALIAIYVILRVEGHIVAIAQLPIASGLRAFVNNPGTVFIFLAVLLLALIFFFEGFHSKRAFWRALIEGALLAVFIFPRETAIALGYVVQGLADFGAGLYSNVTFAIIWGLLGMVLALQRLTQTEGPPSGAKG